MRIIPALVFCLCLSSFVAFAQTEIDRGPLLVGDRVEYITPANVRTVADALTFEARLLRDGMPVTAATASSGLTCAGDAMGVVCSWPLTQSNIDALNSVGIKNLTLTLFRQDVGESPASSPFRLTVPPGAPTRGRFIR